MKYEVKCCVRAKFEKNQIVGYGEADVVRIKPDKVTALDEVLASRFCVHMAEIFETVLGGIK